MDPPDHTRIRRFVTQAFTARRIEELRTPVRRIADELLDAVAPHGRADLVAAYAAPLPIAVICELLGVPPHSRRDFRDWTDALVAPDPAQPGRAKQAIGSMLGFFHELLAHKRAEPADDLLSALIAVREEGEDRLSEDELTSLAFLILFAGYENTVQLIGNATLALLRHPDELAALRADPTRIGSAVEELARYDGPALLAIRRFPVEDVTIGGVTVPAGETVLLSLASADRDSARFPEPDRLDLSRDTAGHLALGHGIHYCLGAPLARLETGVALGALLERFPGWRSTPPRASCAGGRPPVPGGSSRCPSASESREGSGGSEKELPRADSEVGEGRLVEAGHRLLPVCRPVRLADPLDQRPAGTGLRRRVQQRQLVRPLPLDGAVGVPPLPAAVLDRQPVREARGDTAVDEGHELLVGDIGPAVGTLRTEEEPGLDVGASRRRGRPDRPGRYLRHRGRHFRHRGRYCRRFGRLRLRAVECRGGGGRRQGQHGGNGTGGGQQ